MFHINIEYNTPNSWSGIVATHAAIIAPAIIAPERADTRADAIGCAEPKIAPNRPATTARAVNK